MDCQDKTNSLFKKNREILKILLRHCETQKDLIKISSREQIMGFLTEKRALVAKLIDVEKKIENDLREIRDEEKEAIKEEIRENEAIKRRIIAVENEDRETARNEMIVIRSVLEGIKKGKKTLKKYKTVKNRPARYIDVVR